MLLHLAWLVPLVLIIAFLSSPRFRGDIAQTRTRRLLSSQLERSRYTVLNDVVLPAGGGSTSVDHLVLSRFGVFVIESCYAPGKVSGGAFQDRWKRQHWGRTWRFDNPVHQGALKAEAVSRLLHLPASKTVPLVVLVGHSGFGPEVPASLVSAEQLIGRIRKRGSHVLEPEQVNGLLKAIEDARVRPKARFYISQWQLLRLLLFVVLLAGIWLLFREDISELISSWEERQQQRESPELFRQDGSRKSTQELWEDSLICAWSSDTGRCACYEPEGRRVELETARCRELAERGSVLKQ